MSSQDETRPSVDGERQIDQMCDEFERAFHAGTAPDIEEYINSVATADRPFALRQLLPLEIELLAANGKEFAPDDYRHRFADYPDVVSTVLHHVSNAPASVLTDATVVMNQPPPKWSLYRLSCPECNEPVAANDAMDGGEIACPTCGNTFVVDRANKATWSPDELPKLGKFQLLEVVGRGSFGTVYRARDTQLDRIVAVKVPRSGTFSTEQDEQRFVGEARKVAHLSHRGIVPVYDVGRENGVPYIVTEFVEGMTLSDALSFRKFSARETAELVSLIAATLQHAHQKGVVHRDLKPANIMLESRAAESDTLSEAGSSSGSSGSDSRDRTLEFRPRLMDFGLARREGDKLAVTMEGQVLGTPAYMSPEQARGEAHSADGRADIYSLGVITYELLAGERPFRGNVRAVLHQIVNDDAPSIRRLNSSVSNDLDTICLKCLEKKPENRYQSAGELHDELQRFLSGEPILARPISSFDRAVRWCLRRKAMTITVATSVAAVLLAVTIAFVMIARSLDRVSRMNDKLLSAKDLAVLLGSEWGTTLGNYTAVMLDVRGDTSGAESLAMQAADVFEGLLQEEPTRAEYREALARARTILGAAHYYARRFDSAVKELEQAQAQFDILLNGSTPDEQPEYLHSRAAATIFLANTLRAMGRYQACRHQFTSTVAAYQELIQRHNLERYEESLAIAQLDLGQLLHILAENRAAEETLRDALQRARSLPRDSAQRQELEAACLDELGTVLADLGRNQLAMRHHRDAVQALAELVDANPGLPALRQRLAIARSHLGLVHHKLGRSQDSLESFRLAILGIDDLRDVYETTDFAADAALIYEQFSRCMSDQDELEDARQASEIAGALWDEILRVSRGAEYLNYCARFLIECPVESLRDYDLAVALAEEATSAVPSNANYHTSLGMALYRSSNHGSADAAFQEAIRLRGFGTDYDHYFRAMLAWAENRQDIAAQRFEEANRWREDHRPDHLPSGRLRDECATMLGLSDR